MLRNSRSKRKTAPSIDKITWKISKIKEKLKYNRHIKINKLKSTLKESQQRSSIFGANLQKGCTNREKYKWKGLGFRTINKTKKERDRLALKQNKQNFWLQIWKQRKPLSNEVFKEKNFI